MENKGTKENPWTKGEVPKHTLYGNAAIKEVESIYGIKLTAPQKRIVTLEGFVPGFYKDDRGVMTYGVGQTGEWIDKGFVAAYEHHQDLAEDIFGSFNRFTPELQGELMSLTYRGDVKRGYNWVRQFNQGNYEEAADQLLIHREYMDRKASGKKDGVVKRLEDASNIIKNFVPQLRVGDNNVADANTV